MSRLYKRGDSPNWWYTHGTPPTRIMRSTGTSSLKLANMLKRKWDEELFFKKHRIPTKQQISISDICQRYKKYMMDKKQEGKGIAYIKQKQKYIDNFNSFMMIPRNRKVFASVDAEDIDRYIVHRLKIDKVTPKTIKDDIRVIGLMFDYAIKYKYYDEENPCKNPDIPKHKGKKRRPVPVQFVLEALKARDVKQSDKVFWSICYYTGLRASDAGTLSESQVLKDRILIHDTDKADVPVEIPLHPNLKKQNIINVYTDKYDRDKSRERFQAKLIELGYNEPADLHSLRHTFNTVMLESGLGSKDRKKLLAHSSEEVNADIYTHENYDLISSIINKIP